MEREIFLLLRHPLYVRRDSMERIRRRLIICVAKSHGEGKTLLPIDIFTIELYYPYSYHFFYCPCALYDSFHFSSAAHFYTATYNLSLPTKAVSSITILKNNSFYVHDERNEIILLRQQRSRRRSLMGGEGEEEKF